MPVEKKAKKASAKTILLAADCPGRPTESKDVPAVASEPKLSAKPAEMDRAVSAIRSGVGAMHVQSFRGRDLKTVLAAAEEALGVDAMILRTKMVRGRSAMVEVVAAAGADVLRLKQRLESRLLQPPELNSRKRPLVLALVGPTGSGKTTTLAKLAVNSSAFGGWKVGFLTIDTFRTGAIEQLESYARVTRNPLEIVYTIDEVEGALERLSKCDVILVDSPGRSPKHAEHNSAWMNLLRALRPDEVHMVVPAGLRLDAALTALAAYETVGITHLLLSKLDEVHEDAGVAEAAIEMRLPTRWITDGQDVPADLHPAVKRILSSLGAYGNASVPLRIPA
jgi:flagellar biosynthesis protein FlhF